MAPEPDAYFVRTSDRTYAATARTGGGWSTTEQHISPLNGLAVHAIDAALPSDDGKVVSRLTFDILGPVAIGEVAVEVSVLRPGRTVELVEAVVSSDGRAVLCARAWRLARFDTAAVVGGQPPSLPAPQQVPPWPMTDVWPGGFIESVGVRQVPGAVPGRAVVWVSSPLPLVADETSSPLAAFVALVDTANGIAARQPPDAWLFPNVDLTIHLHRLPVAGAVGLDTTVLFGADGLGVTSTVLHDEQGPVGVAAQSLTVRQRPRR